MNNIREDKLLNTNPEDNSNLQMLSDFSPEISEHKPKLINFVQNTEEYRETSSLSLNTNSQNNRNLIQDVDVDLEEESWHTSIPTPLRSS